jgi:proprotein convertase subtilisin/kexin type 5
MNSNGKCNSVSVLCKTSDMNGLCNSCYNGYDLTQGQCVLSSTSTDNVDPSCKVWDYKFQKCIKCAERFVMRPNGACNPVSNLCKTFSEINGLCTSCHAGYDLTQGDCALSNSNNGQPSDLGCKNWDWNRQVCLECSSRWFFNSKGVCTQVSDNCQSYDSNGVCTACYYGYSLSGNQCVALNNNVQPTDAGCKTWDWRRQVCLECSNRWVFDSKGVCTPIKDSCKSYISNGACSACFAGYTLSQGQCVSSSSNTASPSDAGCKTWDWNRQVCLECSSRWFFNSKGVCTQVSDNCKSFTLNGDCSACWAGYDLIQGACVRNTSQPLNVNCKAWDWNKQVCLECANRFVFNSNGICVSVSDNCRTFDNSGFCTGCYNGYTLSQGQCVSSSSNTASPSDAGCKTWDWNRQVCLECSSRWFFNSKGVCTQISDNCAQFSSSGLCSACYKDY